MANVPGTSLPEVVGTGGADVVGGRGGTAVFGGRGDDTFRAAPTAAGQYLAGGSGADLYLVPAGASVVVTEGFGYQGDVVRARALDLSAPTAFVAEIDGRHLLIGDTASDTN